MKDAGSEEIPVGRRLVRASGGTNLSLSERLASQFYRLTWRTPLHALKLRGRYPLKLLAVPEDPLAGDPAIGHAMLEGVLYWRGEAVALGTLEARREPALADHYHSFALLRDLAATGMRQRAAPVAEALVRNWLAAHAETVSEPAWRADLAGRRLLFWAAHAPLILSSSDLVYRSAVLNGFARTARHLDRTADRAPPGLERIAAWCGIVSTGLLIAGGNGRRSFGEAGLAKALASGMTSDGGLVSRAPDKQLELIELLTMLKSTYAARKLEMPEPIDEALTRAVPALLGVTMGDGGLASWQGGRPFSRLQIERVINASGVRTRPLRQAREWGYQRLVAGATVLTQDAAPPPLNRLASHGCASTLAFELSDGIHRLIVNCGGARIGGRALGGGLAEGLRTTAAHSTLIVNDTNSTAILADGGIGRGVVEVELDRQESDGGSRIEASHDGYARRFGLRHCRTLALTSDGRELRGEDALLPAGRKRKSATTGFAIRFHLAPGVEATPTADGMGALLRIDGGPLWQFRCRGAALTIEPSLWVDAEGTPHNTQQLAVNGEAAPGGASIAWLLKRAG